MSLKIFELFLLITSFFWDSSVLVLYLPISICLSMKKCFSYYGNLFWSVKYAKCLISKWVPVLFVYVLFGITNHCTKSHAFYFKRTILPFFWTIWLEYYEVRHSRYDIIFETFSGNRSNFRSWVILTNLNSSFWAAH